ncbi:MAG: hypothetical protein ACKO7C_06430 [Bacteroidota bacterium]
MIIKCNKIKNPFRSAKRIFFVLGFLGLIHIPGYAQPVQLSDSLKGVFHQPVQPNWHWDTWATYVYGKSLNVQSLKVGALFGKRLELGVAYSWLSNGVYFDQEWEQNMYRMQYELRYAGVYTEVKFFKQGRWSGTLPIFLGTGKSFYQFRDLTDTRRVEFQNNVVVYEPALRFNYNVANLVQVGAGMGYRFMLKSNSQIQERIVSPNFLLTVGFVPEGWWQLWNKLSNR